MDPNLFVDREHFLEIMPESDMSVLLLSFVLTMAVAGINGFLVKKNVIWFMSLLQSKFCPPRLTFRIMWSVSYILMGIASFLVWRNDRDFQSIPMLLYYLQLFVNSFYCPLFFGVKRLDYALVNIALLDIVLIVTVYKFYIISTAAGALLIPYFLWSVFNTALTADFYRLQEGKKRDPIYFTTNYSCHYLYQSELEKLKMKPASRPTVISATPPPFTHNDSLRFRFTETPESLYVQ